MRKQWASGSTLQIFLFCFSVLSLIFSFVALLSHKKGFYFCLRKFTKIFHDDSWIVSYKYFILFYQQNFLTLQSFVDVFRSSFSSNPFTYNLEVR